MPNALDREARLAKLMNSACYGNKDTGDKAQHGEKVENSTSDAGTTKRSGRAIPQILTASGATVNASSHGASSRLPRGGTYTLGDSNQLAVPTTSRSTARAGASSSGIPTNKGRGKNSGRSGACGFTPSQGRAAVSVEESRRAVANRSGREVNAGVQAAVNAELQSLYSAHQSAEGETQRPGATSRHGGPTANSSRGGGASTLAGRAPASASSSANQNRNTSKAPGSNIHTLSSGGSSSSTGGSSRLTETTEAYRQSRGTTARRLEDVGADTMTADQRERVAKARKVAGKDPSGSSGTRSIDTGSSRSNVHGIAQAPAGGRGRGKPVTTGGRARTGGLRN
ncbi:unnamed protein product [Amoebophrya sp. A25]|nr:unnamed protein product [Amoebophrya sp. A25]|eukprot:GSA25T00015834001.1